MSAIIRIPLIICLVMGTSLEATRPAYMLANQSDGKAGPCTESPSFHQLDFWVGMWDTSPWKSPAGTVGARNEITAVMDGCLVMEHYTSPGYEGRSFNYYDPHLNQWRQIWVDQGGTISDVVGGMRQGEFQLTGPGFNPAGVKILRKMTLRPIAADTVRQIWETSRDDGKTWMTVVDMRYVRAH